MSFNHRHYVPCLRWKQGEYLALERLDTAAKDFITPLIDVPEISFDFETRTPKKTVDDHLAPFAERVRKKWETRPCFVDARLVESERMADCRHAMAFTFDELRSQGCLATPVTGLSRDDAYQEAIRQAISLDGRGLCLRITIEEAANDQLRNMADAFLERTRLPASDCDLIVDLGAPPNFEPIEGFAKLIVGIIRRLPYLSRWRTFALMGTSFPSSMARIRKSPATIPRFEWMVYKRVLHDLAGTGTRVPTFGDYGINHPHVITADMRLVKPYATIRYTGDDCWFIVKGPNVRDNGYEQYRDHCENVIESVHYCGKDYSYGDAYLADCAEGGASTGNLTTWRKVGTNHHVEKVVQDVSSFFDSLELP